MVCVSSCRSRQVSLTSLLLHMSSGGVVRQYRTIGVGRQSVQGGVVGWGRMGEQSGVGCGVGWIR